LVLYYDQKGMGKKLKIYCEGACDHVALWNFRLRFEPSGLPPLKNQPENRRFFMNRRFIKVYQQATTEALSICTPLPPNGIGMLPLSSYGQSDIHGYHHKIRELRGS
jgi:hypothetical protein